MEIQRHHLALSGPRRATGAAPVRYEVLEAVADVCVKREVRLLAFGFDSWSVRLVLEGEASALRSVTQGLWRRIEATTPLDVDVVQVRRGAHSRLEDDVVWAHRGPLDADPSLPGLLASPWCSHRDLLGYRQAPFYDRSVLARRVSLDRVHERCGGGPPVKVAPEAEGGEDLLLLSRVAASVLGRRSNDPRCFSLFAQLALARGWTSRDVADALLITRRRVRQLCDRKAKELSLALAALAEPETLGRLP